MRLDTVSGPQSKFRSLDTSGLRLLKTSCLQITIVIGREARSGPRVQIHLLKLSSPLSSPPFLSAFLFPYPPPPPPFRSLSASVFPSVKWRQHWSETPFCLPGMIWERVRSCLGRLGELQRRPKINSSPPNCLEEQRLPQPQLHSPIIMGEGGTLVCRGGPNCLVISHMEAIEHQKPFVSGEWDTQKAFEGGTVLPRVLGEAVRKAGFLKAWG